ncbi:MAG: redoxin domain-containing protein [Candidatus Eremiobacteraeota bacterium]|nr:redoxin domain-containing protein [Candidatus Eremiobacteraeota bacterium]
MAQVGKPASDFKLDFTKGATSAIDLGKSIKLSDYKGKWLVFFFYPPDFTFVRPTEISALSNRSDELKEYDAEILELQALQTGDLCPAEWKPGKALLQKV